MSTTTHDIEPQAMPPDALATYLLERLEKRIVDHVVAWDQLTVTVTPAALPAAVRLCRDDPRLAFDFFDFMSGVDEREDGFAVVTHLYSTRHRHHIQIRALAEGGRTEPRLPTISHLYAGANWHEREAYDMYGITFDGHPGLLPRILTVENFEGFPLRKEFLLMTREVKPWPGLKEPKEAGDEEEGDGDAATTTTGPSAEDKARMAREKAERAKAKAAEARKRRAREQAGEQAGPGSPAPDAVDPQAAAARADGEVERPGDNADVGAEKDAELAAGSGDDEIAGDPFEAAAVADTAVAKDAAAGAVGGDTAAGAPGDVPGGDQPIEDDARERELSGGAPARDSGTPGVEAEGRHAGADAQGGDVPASETRGMVADAQDAEQPSPPAGNVPAPAEDPPRTDPSASGSGDVLQPLEHDEPRALAGDGVSSVPLADGQDATVGETVREEAHDPRPVGTDADDRLRDLDERGAPAAPGGRPAREGRAETPASGDDASRSAPDDADEEDQA